MYHDYFGLKEQAFSIAVNPRYLYMSQQHKEALAHLLYGVKGGGFVMLTGEVGTGKTTIVRSLLEQLPKNAEIAIILNPMANVIELLQTISDELGAPYMTDELSVKSLTDALHHKLLENHRNGKNTVLLIDEAQLLEAEVLEQIRLLTNLETATQKLLQIILVGQPELNDLLALPRLRQLSQRIVARFHLRPLTLEETQYYIEHRLSVAGLQDGRSPFSPAIVKRIHQFSGGIPRIINVICERTLIGAYGHNKQHIDDQILGLAKKEVMGERKKPTGNSQTKEFKVKIPAAKEFFKKYYWQFTAAVGGVLVLCLIVLTVLLLRTPEKPAQAITNTSTQNNPEAIVVPTAEPISTEIQIPIDSDQNDTILAEARLPDPLPETNQETPALSEQLYDLNQKFDITDKGLSESVYFKYLGFELSNKTPPCWQVNRQGYECKQAKFETWDDVIRLNRPLVLTLITPDKFFSYAVLVGLEDSTALVINENGVPVNIPLSEIGPLWTGRLFYVWNKPEGFSSPLKVGDKSQLINEVAEKFALLDGQDRTLAKESFNRALERRIKIFQSTHGMIDDGILGQRTLMKLNEEVGESFVLQNDFN